MILFEIIFIKNFAQKGPRIFCILFNLLKEYIFFLAFMLYEKYNKNGWKKGKLENILQKLSSTINVGQMDYLGIRVILLYGADGQFSIF